MNKKNDIPSSATPISPIIGHNIRTLLELRRAEEKELGWQDKMAAWITNFTGSMEFVYIHAVGYGLWIAISQGWIRGIPRFDPTLVILAMEASVEAIFLSTFILITQKRMMAESDRRADLNLQISLLAEHEITRLITLTREMAKSMGIEEAQEPELEELSKDVAPEQVLKSMDEQERSFKK